MKALTYSLLVALLLSACTKNSDPVYSYEVSGSSEYYVTDYNTLSGDTIFNDTVRNGAFYSWEQVGTRELYIKIRSIREPSTVLVEIKKDGEAVAAKSSGGAAMDITITGLY